MTGFCPRSHRLVPARENKAKHFPREVKKKKGIHQRRLLTSQTKFPSLRQLLTSRTLK